MKATVSVIIPTYNYGRFIGDAIESVLKQTYPIAEIVVVDDGSTDETEEEVKVFGERVKLIKQPNGGVCAARNTGIETTASEYIAFLDADDTWLPEKIGKQIAKFAEDEQIGLVHCGRREFAEETGETIEMHLEGGEGWVAEDLVLWEKPIVGPGGSIVVRRDVIDDVGGFDTRLTNGEDWEFCFRVAKKYKVGFVREPLLNYRNHGANAHLNITEMERSTVIAWAKAFDTDDKRLLRLRRKSYGNLHKVLAGSYLRSGKHYSFLRNLIKSLWFRPSYLPYYFRLLVSRRRNN